MILPVCYFIFSTSRHWHYWYHVGENMDDTRLQDFLAFAFDTYIRPSAISFPPRSRIHISHPRSLSIYLSILSIYHRLLLWKQSETSSSSCRSAAFLTSRPSLSRIHSQASFIQLPRKYIISYTHSIAITLIHHSSSSHFYFFYTRPAGFRIQNSVYMHTLHYVTHRRAVDSLLIPFPLSFSFLFLFFSSVHPSSPFRVLWIIEIVMSFCFLHQNKTVISAGKP